jgi:dTDP-4-dehydrorhamnose reductase
VKVLITGAAGQVGGALLGSVPAGTEVRALTHQQLDIADAAAVHAAVSGFTPDAVINCAAYTAVDQAESDADSAAAFNAQGPLHLAQACREVRGCRMIQISTDYVFDGQSAQAYKPDDPPNPLNVYGRTKLAGERAVLETLGRRAVVLRTSWVYAAQGKNFLLTMVRLMRERGSVRVVADQRGSPTAAGSVARALWRAVERSEVEGVLHWSDEGVVSWYEFARAIAEELLAVGLLTRAPTITPITTVEYPTPARRPANSVLDKRASQWQLGIAPAGWRDSLHQVVTQLRG